MIQFEVIRSPDDNVIAPFKYFQNQIYLGNSSGDLWIEDKELYSTHAMLEVVGNELLIHPQRGVEFYLINGKRASAIRKLKRNDEITLGSTTIKIVSFEESDRESKKSLLNDKLSKLVEQNSPRLPVIERLSKLMKQ